MSPRWALPFSAAIEAATGVALVFVPDYVAHLLLGPELSEAGIAVARVAGFALLSLGVACWPKNGGTAEANRALFAYNLLAGLYLAYLRVAGGFRGLMLVPACILHLLAAVSLSSIGSHRD